MLRIETIGNTRAYTYGANGQKTYVDVPLSDPEAEFTEDEFEANLSGHGAGERPDEIFRPLILMYAELDRPNSIINFWVKPKLGEKITPAILRAVIDRVNSESITYDIRLRVNRVLLCQEAEVDLIRI